MTLPFHTMQSPAIQDPGSLDVFVTELEPKIREHLLRCCKQVQGQGQAGQIRY